MICGNDLVEIRGLFATFVRALGFFPYGNGTVFTFLLLAVVGICSDFSNPRRERRRALACAQKPPKAVFCARCGTILERN